MGLYIPSARLKNLREIERFGMMNLLLFAILRDKIF
jgi:hypothetical protein